MPTRSDTPRRVLETAAELFRRQGYADTGLKQVIAESGTPWGSLYHFFPGGKEQIAEQALRHAGARFENLMTSTFERSSDPRTAVHDFFLLSADALERSDFADGCPIGAVAAEVAATMPILRDACADVFAAWRQRIADLLISEGMPAETAHQLAVVILSMFEGAIVLSQSQRSTEALRTAAEYAARMIANEPKQH